MLSNMSVAGPGTYYHHNRDVFTGHYVADKRAGLGTLYLVEKGKKLVLFC